MGNGLARKVDRPDRRDGPIGAVYPKTVPFRLRQRKSRSVSGKRYRGSQNLLEIGTINVSLIDMGSRFHLIVSEVRKRG